MTDKEVYALIEKAAAEKAKKAVSSWAADAWQAATSAGVLDGTAPQGNLTREQFAVILGKLGLISDDTEPSKWAANAWNAATSAGVLDGTNPHGLVTREQLAQVLKNLQLIGAGMADVTPKRD